MVRMFARQAVVEKLDQIQSAERGRVTMEELREWTSSQEIDKDELEEVLSELEEDGAVKIRFQQEEEGGSGLSVIPTGSLPSPSNVEDGNGTRGAVAANPEETVLAEVKDIPAEDRDEALDRIREAARKVDWDDLEEDLEEDLEKLRERRRQLERRLDRVELWFEVRENLKNKREVCRKALTEVQERRENLAMELAETGEGLERLEQVVEEERETTKRYKDLQQTTVADLYVEQVQEEDE